MNSSSRAGPRRSDEALRVAEYRHPAFASSLANGLRVLQSFSASQPALSNKELVLLTGLSKGTVSRLTSTLVEKGMLVQDSRTRCFRLGAGVLGIAYPMLAGLKARQVARPFMQELANLSAGTVSMGLRDRLHMVYVETVRGHDLHAFRPEIGARLPLAATAMGRAWYAQTCAAQRDELLLELRNGGAEDGQALAALDKAQADYLAKGYCVSQGDWHPDVHAVAAAMPSPVDNELLIFNCGVRTSQLKGGEIDKLFGNSLLGMIEKIRMALERGAS